MSRGLVAPPGGLAAYRPQQLYSLFNADVSVTDVQVRMTEVAENFRRFERQTDSSRVIGGRDRALRVAFSSLADNMAAFSASCQLSADLITYVFTSTHSSSLSSSSYDWLRGTAVERGSLTGELSLSCARPTADGDHL